MKASLPSSRIAKRLLAIARMLIAANLTDNQRGMIERAERRRKEGLDFGTAFNWDAAGRAYFTVTRTIPDIQAPQEIVDALKKLGYSISSYRDGKAIKTIEVREGKKTQVKKIGKILQQEVDDGNLYKLFMNRLGTSNKSDNRKFLVCITHNPEDVGAMSTGRNWTSCMHLPDMDAEKPDEGGAYYSTALRQVQYGGMCAYLIDENDKTIENPYARIAIKRLENNGTGAFIYVPENIIYGDGGLADECGMKSLVQNELDRANRITRQAGGIFRTSDPASYSDSRTRSIALLDDENRMAELDVDSFKEYAMKIWGPDRDARLLPVFEKYLDSLGSEKDRKNIFGWIVSHAYELPVDFLEKYNDLIDWNYISFKIWLIVDKGNEKKTMDFLERHKKQLYWPGIIGALKGFDPALLEHIKTRFNDVIRECIDNASEDPIDDEYDWSEYMLERIDHFSPSSMMGIETDSEHSENKDMATWHDSCTASNLYANYEGDNNSPIPKTMASIEREAMKGLQDFANDKFPGKSGLDVREMYLNDELDEDDVEVMDQYMDDVLDDDWIDYDLNISIIKNYYRASFAVRCVAKIASNYGDEITYENEVFVTTGTQCRNTIDTMLSEAFDSFPSAY